MSQNSQNLYFAEPQSSYQFSHQNYPINHNLYQESSSIHLQQNSPSDDRFQVPSPTQNQKKVAQTTQNNTNLFEMNKDEIKAEKKVTDQKIVFKSQVVQRNRQVLKGQKNDTVQLNIHFKTILSNFLKELIYANELNSTQIAKFKQFCKRVPSFKSLKEFLCPQNQDKAVERLRRMCLEFVESGQCVRRILCCRCKFGVKLQMLKFVSKFGANMKQAEIVRWKEEANYFKIYS